MDLSVSQLSGHSSTDKVNAAGGALGGFVANMCSCDEHLYSVAI